MTRSIPSTDSSPSTPPPVVVIGAGPVGLAAAVHLLDRGIEPLVFEAGSSVAHHVDQWRHVRMFSPWEYDVDPVAARFLAETGWTAPPADELPTGDELLRLYLEPLADHPRVRPFLRFGARVVGVARRQADRLRSTDRERAPFVVYVEENVEGKSEVRRVTASAVIDASGTWGRPNPAGADGLPALGERALRERIVYGIPDVAGRDRARFAGRRVAVVGAGHSAIQSILALLELDAANEDEDAPTRVHWILRRATPESAFGGTENDALPARGELGARIRDAVVAGRVQVHGPFFVDSLAADGERIAIHGRTDAGRRMIKADELIVATGARPDLSFLGEVRLDLDPIVEAPRALAPLIDPNLHSCGTVPPHGEAELRHPEPGFYLVGSKAYGRAPTFLLRTGYEQVRSVAAHLAGDAEAARRLELVLPATGVCSSDAPTKVGASIAACCGGAC